MRTEDLRADRTLKGVLIGLIAVALLTAFGGSEEGTGGTARRENSPAAAASEPGPGAGQARGERDQPRERAWVASWYGEFFRGRATSCGDRFDPDALTAAHRSLPCGSVLRVEHGDRRVTVEVTDRGPYVRGRELDLSRAAFARLAPLGRGLLEVRATLLRSA